jgi:GAG-pre-integrase domain
VLSLPAHHSPARSPHRISLYWFIITYIPSPVPSQSDSALAAIRSPDDPDYEFYAYVALEGQPHTSVDWGKFCSPMNIDSSEISLSTYLTLQTPVSHLQESPFILDSGASCHISPDRSDFKSLHPITPHPIKGFGSSCVYAVGIGTIELCIASGKRITLNHALFVPNATIRLISVYTINNNGHNACHFDSNKCWVTNSSGVVVLTGKAWVPCRLYILNCLSPTTVHVKPPLAKSAALYAARVPDLETWHRRLGHCNHRSIIDMAHQGVVEGMPIDLSSAPPACDHCILGKQTRSHVPRMREGSWATRRLERVFVNLDDVPIPQSLQCI